MLLKFACCISRVIFRNICFMLTAWWGSRTCQLTGSLQNVSQVQERHRYVTQIRLSVQYWLPWQYSVCTDASKLPTYTTCNWNSVLFHGSRRLSRPVICQEPLCPVRRGGVTTVSWPSGHLHPMQLNSCRLYRILGFDV